MPSTFYIDPLNGSDAGTGADWANAWKTITLGATAARIAPGDVIRIAKSPAPYSIGNGTWTDCPSTGFVYTNKAISSSTNASPIEITTSAAHGYSTGDIIYISGHTTNTTANGAWKITYVSTTKFTLDGSVGVGTGGAAGNCNIITSKAVVLATAQTADIDRCEVAWTANGSGDVSPVALTAVATDAKEGGYCMKFTLDAAVQTSTMQAYKAITSTNFSTYQKISFWIKNEAAIVDNNWLIALCSDTAGATPVDVFRVTAIPSTTQWVPLTLAREYSVAFTGGTGTAPTAGTTVTGASSSSTAVVIRTTLSSGTWAGGDAAGTIFVHTRSAAFQSEQVNFSSDHFHIGGDFAQGNLGSAIQSIAIYSDSANTGMASKYIYLDNFIACTTSGLNLQSLISKNSSEQGGTEGWYGIQSINGVIVLLDNGANTKANAGQGYSGTPATATTYARETFKTALASASTTVVQEVMDSGTFGTNIEFQGGYNTGTSEQTGETFFDGMNGLGYGLQLSSKAYVTLNCLNMCRYYYGLYLISSNSLTTDIKFINNNGFGSIYLSAVNTTTFANLGFLNNNTNGGLNFLSSNNNTFTSITSLNNSGSYGINLSGSSYNIFKSIGSLNNNVNFGVNSATSLNNLFSIGSSNKGTAISMDYGDIYLINTTLTQSTEFSIAAGATNNWIYSLNHDNQLANHWMFTYNATVNWQATTVHSTEPGSWKTAITGSARTTQYPVKLKVAEVAVAADAQVTVTAWVKKDHATNVGCKLIHYATTGIASSEASATKAGDTDWQQLTIQFTPGEAGVAEIYLETWYVADNSNTYIGTITATQA